MLDKLKALFIVQEGKEKTTEDRKKKVSIDFTKKGVSESKIYSETEGTASNEIMTKLLAILNANNQVGFDYLEYKNAIKSLEAMEMDEKTRYRSAFATAKTLGVTVPKLLKSIGFYQKVLNEERIKFIKTLKNNNKTNVDGREEDEILKKIASKKKEIKQLTKEISELEKKLYGSLNGHTSSDFEATTNKLIQEMREDIKKINKYL